MVDGIALLDGQGRVLVMNEAGRRILRVPEGQECVFSSENVEFYRLDGERLPLEASPAHRALRGETVAETRCLVRFPWGDTVALGITASPVRDAEGRVVGATSVFRDVGQQVELERRREELYQREHQIAEMLQQVLVPRQRFVVPGCDVAVRYHPASEEPEIVGGDFYDIFRVGEDKYGILIGDVAGKGLLAAMRVAEARYAIRSYAYLDPSPSRVMTLANEALCKDQPEESPMLTAFFGVLDVKSRTLSYANAGHEPPMIWDSSGRVQDLPGLGRALGVLEGFHYPEAECRLEPGDVVVMITDGITEARQEGIGLFDKSGVVRHLENSPRTTLEEIASGLLEAAKAHSGGRLQDDAAILVLQISGPGLSDAGGRRQHEERQEGPASRRQLDRRSQRAAVTITAAGDLDRASSEEIRRQLEAAATSSGEVTIDFRAVTFVDTAVLDALAKAANAALQHKRRLKVILSQGSQPLRALEAVGFDEILEITVVEPPPGTEERRPSWRVGPRIEREEFSIELGDDPRDLTLCREAALQAAARAGFSRQDQLGIASAVYEACVNAVTHGRSGGRVHALFSLRVDPERLEAVVEDSGGGFTCPVDAEMPHPTARRGRGVPLMKAFMDEVRFESGAGCKVTMVKYRRRGR